ncbi:hypothetical protein [Ellagibacter isourolithinifaciens]|uniref:hypothetical protein n=1 Tax=Ellagibacter isourolithinifaciens TaxID=2137581 RepID=UPI003AAC1D94
MSENLIETAANEADSPSEETQKEVCEALSEGAGEVVDSEGVEEDELADSENVVEEETEEAEKYETVEIEYSEDDIEAYIVDEDDNEIGFILLDEDGNEVEYYYDDDEEAAKGESDEDNPYDLGITREGVAEATSDMNDIYRDGVAIAVDLKDALSEIKEALDFSDILPTKKK